VSKILKNVGKYSKFSLLPKEELSFYNDIKTIIEKKYDCTVKIIIEKDSEEKKAAHALPGKPAIIIS
ncbi:MAG: hypothetical protein ACFFAH_14500, partial [Promethearchaeota archaeon]